MSKKKTYRMYGFVPYNISPIQQGIQFGHAVVEYANKYGDKKSYRNWATKDKTFIILNGGTTKYHKKKELQGSMQTICDELDKFGIRYATFDEPDLNDALTGIVFLVESKVFDFEINYELTEQPKEAIFALWLKGKRLA